MALEKPPQIIIDSQHLIRITPSDFISHQRGNLRSHYKIGVKLGEGSYGFVRLATHIQTGLRRAVKTIKKEQLASDLGSQDKFINEIEVLKRTDHPNIMRLYEVYEDSHYYHLVTEYLSGGELFDYVTKSGRLNEPIAAYFMKQVLSGVAYCHSKNIVHRDLKPENLLLEQASHQSSVKIIDFGTSVIGKESLSSRKGTSNYVAPEVLRKHYNEKCDVWSCGVILYVLLSGRLPFVGKNQAETLQKVSTGIVDLDNSQWNRVSGPAKGLLRKMLAFNPGQRISASAALKDQWIARFSNSAMADARTMSVALTNLRNFRAEVKFQHAVLAYIASQLVRKEQSKKLAQLFGEMDKNGDGQLSKEELVSAYSKSMGVEEARAQVELIFEQVDVDYSGFIDYTEFIMASLHIEEMVSQRNLKVAFDEFDADKNGKISPEELKQIFGKAENGVGYESMWKQVIAEADRNGDGEIDLSEFRELMMRIFQVSVR